MKTTSMHRFGALLLAFAVTAMAGCGGGGGGGDGDAPAGTVEASLQGLGVPMSDQSRVDDDRDALPDDYGPFGKTKVFDPTVELMMVGLEPGASFGGLDSLVTVFEEQPQTTSFRTETLFAASAAQTPWAESVGAAPGNLRTALRADVDADGLDELLVVYREVGTGEVRLAGYDDRTAGFQALGSVVIGSTVPQSLEAVAGDFDGDGYVDVVVGIVTATGAELVFLENSSGVLALSGETRNLSQLVPGSRLHLSLAAGNLDYDNPQELALTLTEFYTSGVNETATARYWVFDDAPTGYALVAGPQVVRASAGGVTRTALTADVAVGDIDADNVDEIVFAGLPGLDATGTCNYGYLLVALDDLKRGMASLGADYVVPDIHGACSSSSPGELRWVHVNTLDMDDDGGAEVQANQYLFEDWREGGAAWVDTGRRIDDAVLFADNGGFTGRFDADNSAMAVGDMTADQNADVMVYSQSGTVDRVSIWGQPILPPVGGAPDWVQVDDIEVMPPAGSDPVRPLLVAANVDRDSLALSLSEAEYRLVFTEPVVLAVLAAAPCATNLGQDLGNCTTGFGTSESQTVDREFTWTVTAGVSAGFKAGVEVFGQGVETEVVGTVKAAYSKKENNAYTVTTSVRRTTRGLEDGVIFTSIPYDQYTYTVLSHPNPDVIGQEIVVSLPRSPYEALVPKDFYNANASPEGIRVNRAILAHTPGQPRTYPSAAGKDALLSVYDGYATPQAVDVGVGAGETELGINIYTESGTTTSYGVEAEVEVRATAGAAILGFSIGGGVESSLRISHGQEADYSGSVASVDPSSFGQGGGSYRFGLFTYVMDTDKHPIEVVNYWVE